MINIKLSSMLAAAGFILSLAVGLVSGAGFPLVFVRAGFFGAVFFVLGCGIWLLINNFVPELLFSEAVETGDTAGFGEGPGSRVNITVGGGSVLPEILRNLDHGDDVGNIGDLVSGTFKPEAAAVQPGAVPQDGEQGLDQKPQAGYTENDNHEAPPPGDAVGGMPDMDSFSGAFLGEAAEAAPEPAEISAPVRNLSGNKAQKMDGDFNPKDLAAGIRTVLSKDK